LGEKKIGEIVISSGLRSEAPSGGTSVLVGINSPEIVIYAGPAKENAWKRSRISTTTT
jgi:hypothetical protein